MRSAGARQLREDDELRPRPSRALHLVDAPYSEPAADAAERRVRELRPAEGQSEPRPARAETAGRSARRTVQITGQAAPPRRRGLPTASRVSARPDRVALWAFFLALFLVFMAVVTANAGT
jgi:hypothetical protein